MTGLLRLIVLGCLMLVATPVRAFDSGIRDEARLFSEDAIRRANTAITTFQERHKTVFRIETFRTVPDDKKALADSDNRATRDRVFTEWALERARMTTPQGVYILVTRDPGQVRVVVRGEDRKQIRDEERDAISHKFLERCQKRQSDEGLLEAIRNVGTAWDGKLDTHDPEMATESGSHGNSSASEGRRLGPWDIAGLMGIFLLGAWVILGLLRTLGSISRGKSPLEGLLVGFFGSGMGQNVFRAMGGGTKDTSPEGLPGPIDDSPGYTSAE